MTLFLSVGGEGENELDDAGYSEPDDYDAHDYEIVGGDDAVPVVFYDAAYEPVKDLEDSEKNNTEGAVDGGKFFSRHMEYFIL